MRAFLNPLYILAAVAFLLPFGVKFVFSAVAQRSMFFGEKVVVFLSLWLLLVLVFRCWFQLVGNGSKNAN
ncbi:hypothetical protein DTL42_17260 [Bremerella cremea]|uniref:Uncharacterized protein n=1 Tax=Bremerella cremea TaxID=1031537 RepID=A0A368KNE7_9BACT|nr:hypothetical protein [Bremerella cremea]RCS44671.1 hypothetical protein DTL42_17260 [Bremerella cremea]